MLSQLIMFLKYIPYSINKMRFVTILVSSISDKECTLYNPILKASFLALWSMLSYGSASRRAPSWLSTHGTSLSYYSPFRARTSRRACIPTLVTWPVFRCQQARRIQAIMLDSPCPITEALGVTLIMTSVFSNSLRTGSKSVRNLACARFSGNSHHQKNMALILKSFLLQSLTAPHTSSWWGQK